MLHEALMLEIYRQALNAGALPNPRPRSTESANSSERCPSHDSTSSAENGSASGNASNMHPISPNSAFPTMIPPSPNSNSSHHHQQQHHHHQQHQQQQQHQQHHQQHHHHQQPPPSMEAYLHMVAAAAQQYAQFPLGGGRMPMPIPPAATADPHFKLPPQASPTASSIKSEALDFRTNFKRSSSEDDEEDEVEEAEEMEDIQEDGNPLDLSTSSRKRSADEDDSPAQIAHQTKKLFKGTPPPTTPPAAAVAAATAPLMTSVNPYLAAVAAANIFQNGPYPSGGWNGKNDLVIDPTSCLEKMTDLVKGPRKEKSPRQQTPVPQAPPAAAPIPSSEGVMASKGRHNIWQSHWQNKGVASSVFRCVWCKQSFATLEALTTHMKDSKHCGVNVPPFSNLPNTERPPQQPQMQNHQQMRKPSSQQPMQSKSNYSNYPSNRDPNTPLPRKLVRGQNVWLGKGVEQAMQILKCMRCGESFRSLGEMTKHMQETQHYTNILSQEQTISMKSSGSAGGGDGKDAMSSEESRTLSAVLTCKVCDKAFSSLGDLSNHMAKNNHYAEPLMQSMAGGGAAGRKRQVQKKREKSLPVRKLLEMKGAAAAHADAVDAMEAKMNRNEKMEAAMFAERMRQYICGVKAEVAPEEINKSPIMLKKSPEQEVKNGTAKPGSSSVLSAIEQMFTTSFDTPTRHNNAPQPVNAANKNTSPVASSILKRLGIDETVDYNKPLMDIQDPYYHHYARYTSSERSASECSADNHEAQKTNKARSETPEKIEPNLPIKKEEPEEKENSEEEERHEEKPKIPSQASTPNGELNLSTTDRNHEASPKAAASPESNRSGTPKSPASSHKSFGGDGEKKYPSDSLNALSSMFDSLSSVGSGRSQQHQQQQQQQQQPTIGKSEESLSAASNSLAALRQFCDQKEKTA